MIPQLWDFLQNNDSLPRVLFNEEGKIPWGINTLHSKIKLTVLIKQKFRMKKIVLTVAAAALLCTSLSSCMGRFALTKNLYSWNEQISNKFINEIVFVAFWILPVYEVCGLADLLVINTIEFWSGDNPLTSSTKIIDTDNGRFLVKCDGKGYDITLESTGESYRLDFVQESQTWNLEYDGKEYPLMTFVDDTHVSVPLPGGEWQTVEVSQAGLMAYRAAAGQGMLANK